MALNPCSWTVLEGTSRTPAASGHHAPVCSQVGSVASPLILPSSTLRIWSPRSWPTFPRVLLANRPTVRSYRNAWTCPISGNMLPTKLLSRCASLPPQSCRSLPPRVACSPRCMPWRRSAERFVLPPVVPNCLWPAPLHCLLLGSLCLFLRRQYLDSFLDGVL